MVSQNNDYDYKIENVDLSNRIITLDFLKDYSITIVGDFDNADNSKDIKTKKVQNECVVPNTDDYEKMLYFVCNLCPFLCLKDSKIAEHLENAHKDNKSKSKPLELKCPACPNIFFRNISLKSHLAHDHKVARTELQKIVQSVVYYTKKNRNSIAKTCEKIKPPAQEITCKADIDMTLIEKFMNSEKLINNEHSYSKEPEINNAVCENSMGQVRVVKDLLQKDVDVVMQVPVKWLKMPTLPIIDITNEKLDKPVDTPVAEEKLDTFSKFLDQKKMLQCTISQCKVHMFDPEKLRYHIKTHVENTFQCPECNEIFAFWKPLSAHLWRMHQYDMELYACDKCNYKSTSLGKMNNSHKLIHSDFRAFACDVCQKRFKNTRQLRNHKMIHKDRNKKFNQKCEICTKAFSDKRQLKVHLDVVHKKIKPFLCSYCAYKGASKSSLRMHIRQHTGEKPFSCNTCEYTTADHNSLRRHKLRHTGQKPYKCSHCEYACIQTSTYKEHIRTKHPGVEKDFVFICQECQFRTVNQEMYLSHLFLVHKQKQKILKGML